MVLRNRPTLIIGTERLACLNSPPGVQRGPSPSTRQVPGSSPGSGGRAARAFFLHPPFLPPSGDSFFRTFPTNPAKVLGLSNAYLASESYTMADIGLHTRLLVRTRFQHAQTCDYPSFLASSASASVSTSAGASTSSGASASAGSSA